MDHSAPCRTQKLITAEPEGSGSRLVRTRHLPAVFAGVPLPLLAQEVVQLATFLQLLVLLGQLQLPLVRCSSKRQRQR